MSSEGVLADAMAAGAVDPGAIHAARRFLLAELSREVMTLPPLHGRGGDGGMVMRLLGGGRRPWRLQW